MFPFSAPLASEMRSVPLFRSHPTLRPRPVFRFPTLLFLFFACFEVFCRLEKLSYRERDFYSPSFPFGLGEEREEEKSYGTDFAVNQVLFLPPPILFRAESFFSLTFERDAFSPRLKEDLIPFSSGWDENPRFFLRHFENRRWKRGN